MADSLGAVALKYTALRFACLLGSFAVACAVVLPVNGTGRDSFFYAGLAAIVVSVPLSFWLGRDLRGRMGEALTASREASRARVADTAARVKAVEDARRETDAGGLP